jgi:hypothetical protein
VDGTNIAQPHETNPWIPGWMQNKRWRTGDGCGCRCGLQAASCMSTIIGYSFVHHTLEGGWRWTRNGYPTTVPECTTTLGDLALQPLSEHTCAVLLSDEVSAQWGSSFGGFPRSEAYQIANRLPTTAGISAMPAGWFGAIIRRKAGFPLLAFQWNATGLRVRENDK